MITRGLFYFGRRGHVEALPSVTKGSNPEATPLVFGSRFEGIDGYSTTDVTGVKRQWSLRWDRYQLGNLHQVEAAATRIIDAPVFFVDTRTQNLVSLDASSGGSQTRSTKAFTVDSGGVSWYNHYFSEPLSVLEPLVQGCVSWEPGLSGGRLATVGEVPYITGSSYLFSCYVRPSMTGDVTLSFGQVDTQGAVGSWSATTPVSVSSGGWSRVSVAVPAASGGGVAFRPAIEWGSGDELKTTGWQVSYDTVLGDWVPGTGCPEVTVSDFTRVYPHPTLETCSAVFREV